MNDLEEKIETFVKAYEKYDIDEIYNEFSLQHELGSFLKKEGYKVFFEKNISYYIDADNNTELKNKIKQKNFIKKEIDLVIEKDNERYAIELKYPRNGQQTREFQYFINDMLFMHQTFETKKFKATYCMTWVDDECFYEEPKNNHRKKNIENEYYYNIFRVNSKKNNNKIEISTCKNIDNLKKDSINIKWNNISRGAIKGFIDKKELPLMCYFIKIDSKN